MKNALAHARKLSALLKQLARRHHPHTPPKHDPVEQLTVAFLQWESTRVLADKALVRIQSHLVDLNDLRVSHPDEVTAILGERYPLAAERAGRMHDALQEIFIREHAVTLAPLEKKSRKEVRQYLDTLPGMTPYVAAMTSLLSFEAHHVPVDGRLLGLLRDEGVVTDEMTEDEAGAFLDHHVKTGEALHIHLMLQAWSDHTATKPAKKKG